MRSTHVDLSFGDSLPPLAAAAKGGYLECVRQLLTAGADPLLSRESDGAFALALAVQENHVAVVNELLSTPGDVGIQKVSSIDSLFCMMMFPSSLMLNCTVLLWLWSGPWAAQRQGPVPHPHCLHEWGTGGLSQSFIFPPC